MKPTIDHNTPMPPKRRGPPTKYPFRELGINDESSFFRVAATAEAKSSIRSAAQAAEKRLKAKFTTRQEKNGLRVWRIA